MTPGWSVAVLSGSLAAAPLTDVRGFVPDAVVELRYATADNFLGRAVYPPGARCLVLPQVGERLARVAEAARGRHWRLKFYDCYRPLAVQREMWKVKPQRGYVADPSVGSNHNRGAAVDVTLCDPGGRELPMPAPYDTFGRAAHHGSDAGTEASRANREALRAAMTAEGFRTIKMEWWHYDAPEARTSPVRDEPMTAPP